MIHYEVKWLTSFLLTTPDVHSGYDRDSKATSYKLLVAGLRLSPSPAHSVPVRRLLLYFIKDCQNCDYSSREHLDKVDLTMRLISF